MEDLQASVAELVYSEPSSIPGKLLTPATDPADPAHLTTAPPAHGPPSASLSSTPCLPSYFRAVTTSIFPFGINFREGGSDVGTSHIPSRMLTNHILLRITTSARIYTALNNQSDSAPLR
jgi:hypothetical protein